MTRDDARRGTLREHGEPERGIYFGRDHKQPAGDGVLVHIAREARAVRLRDTSGNTVEAFGDTTRFWLTPAPAEPAALAGATGEAAALAVPTSHLQPPTEHGDDPHRAGGHRVGPGGSTR